MCNVRIISFPASYGESFLIKLDYDSKEFNLLIDCGFGDTYKKYIHKELKKIKKLDLLVLTHIDDDHINGAIKLFGDNKLLDQMEICNIWFNDLYKIIKDKYKKSLKLKVNKNNSNDVTGVINQNVGFENSKTLTNYIYESKYFDIWDKNNGIIQCSEKLYKELYPINDDIKIVLLSPTSKRIDEMLLEWSKYLNINLENIEINDANIKKFYNYFINHENFQAIFNDNCSQKIIDFEQLANEEFSKNSVCNNSSIAFFMEIKNKKILFLGDSNPNDIKLALQEYKKDKEIKDLKFDLVKVSHHGSKNNISNDFFSIFYADRYLISTNGSKFNHPDIECISKILVKQKEFKKIIFNYNRKKLLKVLNNDEIKNKYNYEIIMPDSEGINIEI